MNTQTKSFSRISGYGAALSRRSLSVTRGQAPTCLILTTVATRRRAPKSTSSHFSGKYLLGCISPAAIILWVDLLTCALSVRRRYATNKVCIKDVAIRFNISDSTVHGIIERLLEYLCSLLPKEIRFPQDLDEVVKGFQQVRLKTCEDAVFYLLVQIQTRSASFAVNSSGANTGVLLTRAEQSQHYTT